MEKIKLVVLDEHTIGFIHPETPQYIEILHDSILKGAPNNYNRNSSIIIGKNNKVRLANEKDFDEFRIYNSYTKDQNIEYTRN